jgi:hypothetical protein
MDVPAAGRRTLTAMSVPLAALRCLCALVAVVVLAAPVPAHAATPEVTDEIAASWRTDPVYLYDGLRATFPRSELDRIRAAGRTLAVPVYVALLPDSPYTRENRLDLPTLLQARIGGEGLFMVWVVDDDYWRGTSELISNARPDDGLVRVQLDDKQDNQLRTDLPAPRIVRTIQQAATAIDGRPLPDVPTADVDQGTSSPDELSTTEKKNLAAYIGMGIGGLAGVALVLASWIRNRSARVRRLGGPQHDREPQSTESVRWQAHTAVEVAERALRKLERRISSIRPGHSELAGLLDRRSEASRRLEAAQALLTGAAHRAEDGLTAVAGAFVLGRQAQQAAAGSPVAPPCFFNPLHNAGSTRLHWSGIDVPACRACVRDVRRDDRPDSFLVWQGDGLLGAGRGAVEYWHLDPQDDPLAAIGFGALDEDLPERIRKQFGGRR